MANNIRSKTIDKENCRALFSVIDNSFLRRKRPIGVVHIFFHYHYYYYYNVFFLFFSYALQRAI